MRLNAALHSGYEGLSLPTNNIALCSKTSRINPTFLCTKIMKQFISVYINGQFEAPHGNETVDIISPLNGKTIGKITYADEGTQTN